MTTTTSNYLRIHHASLNTKAREVPATPDTPAAFWQAFSDATGWRPQSQSSTQKKCDLVPSVDIDPLAGADDLDSIPVVARSQATCLADAGQSLLQELSGARETLRVQEAELAARAMLTSEPQREAIADALQKTLADAVAACRCDSAAMYMLDDDTKTLKVRSVFGLPPSRLQGPPRELRGSRGDLEALVQGVICIDDLHGGSVDTWNCPESAGSAICVSINNDSVPVGTLWLFGTQPKQFTSADGAAARMAATQLALRLECARTTGERVVHRQADEALRDVAQWQFTGLPLGTRLADGWLVDGMVESPREWSIGWHMWDVLPDGSLMLAIAEAEDAGLSGAMSAAICRAALTAHTGYRHTPRQLMQRISDTLWQTSTAQQLVSLLYARLDPDTGEGEVASAGNINAIISSQYGYRPLVDGYSPMLTSHIDSQCLTQSFRLDAGETFLAYGPGLSAGGISQQALGDQLRQCMRECDAHPLAAIRRVLAGASLMDERGALTIVRQ